jgi:hypothetical protein
MHNYDVLTQGYENRNSSNKAFYYQGILLSGYFKVVLGFLYILVGYNVRIIYYVTV